MTHFWLQLTYPRRHGRRTTSLDGTGKGHDNLIFILSAASARWEVAAMQPPRRSPCGRQNLFFLLSPLLTKDGQLRDILEPDQRASSSDLTLTGSFACQLSGPGVREGMWYVSFKRAHHCTLARSSSAAQMKQNHNLC